MQVLGQVKVLFHNVLLATKKTKQRVKAVTLLL